MKVANVEQIMGASSELRYNITQKAANRAAREVAGFDGWYSPTLERELVLSVGALADSASTLSASQAELSSATMLDEITGRTSNPSGLMLDGTARKGVTSAEAYARIPKQYGYSRSIGYGKDAARASAIDRVRRMVGIDITLAYRLQTLNFFKRNSKTVTGYRRVIRPELSKDGTCGLCIAASDWIYSTEELLPIHPGCYCEIMPIVGEYDPGRDLNDADITRLYQTADPEREVGAPTRSQLSSVRVVVDDHGEYGPMIRGSQDARKTKHRQGSKK